MRFLTQPFYNYSDSYVAALTLIKENLSNMGLKISASYSMSDFELNIRSAIKEVFPGINLRGCHFHMGQALWNRVVNSGLKSDYSNPKYNMLAGFIRASIGLAYVPLDRLESEALGILKKMAEELGKRHRSFAIDYLAYINRYWVHGQYHPSTWNFYQKHGVSTNNHAEGKHLNVSQLFSAYHLFGITQPFNTFQHFQHLYFRLQQSNW